MPTITRYFIKAAMIYFVVGMAMGFVITAQSLLNLPISILILNPTYLHMLVVGWITQLIFGVAYWMFPKYSKEKPRGNERLGWAIFVLLNGGLFLRVIAEPLTIGWLLPIAAVTEWVAVLLFIIAVWPRVKER
jgi:hypothetical protein